LLKQRRFSIFKVFIRCVACIYKVCGLYLKVVTKRKLYCKMEELKKMVSFINVARRDIGDRLWCPSSMWPQ